MEPTEPTELTESTENNYLTMMSDRFDPQTPIGELYVLNFPEITFLRNIYSRHTDFYVDKIVYNFNNNKIVIPKKLNANNTNESAEIVTKVWINNITNVKSIGVYIVQSTMDLTTIDFTDDNLIEQNESIIPIHKVGNNSILLYDASITRNQYKSDWINLPMGNLCMVPSILTNQNIITVIEKYDENIENSIKIKYFVSTNQEEIRRLNISNLEYLLRRFKSCKHNISEGENIINFDIVNESITDMSIIVPKNEIVKIKVNYDIDIGTTTEQQIIQREIELIKTENDPELSWLTLNDYDIYVLDACSNLTSHIGQQMCGIITIKENSKITITSNSNFDVHVSYTFLSVLRYENGYVKMSKRRLRMVNTEGQNTIDQIPDNQYRFNIGRTRPINTTFVSGTEEQNNEVADENGNLLNLNDPFDGLFEQTNIFQMPSLNDHIPPTEEINSVALEINTIAKSHKLLNDMIWSYAKKTAIVKLLPKEKRECNISYEQINYGDYYFECFDCKNIFNMYSLSKWINKNMTVSSCPMCRAPIYEQPELYKNGYFWNEWTDNLIELQKFGKSAIIQTNNNIFTNITNYRNILLLNLLPPIIKISQC